VRDTVRNINQHFWSSKGIPFLTIRTTQNSTQSYKAHCHSELSIGIIESGTTQLTLLNNEMMLEKADIVLIEPNVVHSCNPLQGQPRSYHMLYIDNTWCCHFLSKLYGYEIKKYDSQHNLLPALDNEIKLSELIHTVLNQDNEETASRLERQVFNLVSRYYSPILEHKDESHLASELKTRLLQDITQAPSLDVIAKELGKPAETLIRCFKKHYGITPKSFLNNNRIEQAKILLRQGMSIVDVSAEVGFSDQSQLHRTFVNYTASTPRQYQQGTSIFDNIP
jgi:AraC-like DNA-binding protein